jgi:hypothetical protein
MDIVASCALPHPPVLRRSTRRVYCQHLSLREVRMATCMSCRKEVDDEAIDCPHCGASMTEPSNSPKPHCGTPKA